MGIFEALKDLIRTLFSYIIAIVRLFFWVIILITSGLQKIIFCRVEICSVEVKGLPLRCDREDMFNNLSYVDKLRAENPELADIPYEEDEEYIIEDDDNENNENGDDN